MPAGRPLKYTPEEINQKIDEYMKSCWRYKRDMYGNAIKDKETNQYVLEQYKPYTMTGFAVYIDSSRETLNEYSNKEEFVDAIKRIKEICHAYAEESLFVGKNPTGAIFNLKNNYGWTDKTELDLGNKDNKPFEVTNLTDEELEKKAVELAEKVLKKE